MDNEDFLIEVKKQVARCRKVLDKKREQYGPGEDRLVQFKTAATLQGVTAIQALGGMMSKHTTSLYDLINDGEDAPAAMWDEKITDHINYLFLLRALLNEDFDV
jgi:hypothetical protein